MRRISQLLILKTAFLILCLLTISSISFAQWEDKSNSLTGEGNAFAIDAIDSLNAVVSFYPGQQLLYKTSNGGETWELVPLEVENLGTVIDLSMINTDNIWLVTSSGKIIKLTNGTQNIETQFYDTSKTGFINYIEMFDENNGIAMGDGKEFQNGIPVFLRTTDGGQNWISMNDSSIGGGSGDTWRRMDFINNNTGYFLESGNNPQKLYKTVTGGSTWEETNFSDYAMILKFYDENFGLAYNYIDSVGTMIKTADGGTTWDKNTLAATGWGNDIEFIPGSPDKVWFTDYKSLYFSGDSGQTWTEEKLTDGQLGGRDIVFTDKNIGWLACDNGKIYRTTNGGRGITSITNKNIMPESYRLMQNYPNPFNPETIISYELPASSFVNLKVYDILGKEITTLVNEFNQAGVHRVKFNSDINSSLSSGVYFYRLKTTDFVEIKKMLLIK